MSCVVVGAGIAGLSVSYFLQKRGIKVTVISSKKKKGAADIFTAILYPYVGRWAKKNKYAEEAYSSSLELIKEAEEKTGEKIIVSRGVIKKFATSLKKFTDVEIKNGDAYVKSGITVDMRKYVLALKKLIGEENFIEREVIDISQIEGVKIIAAGYGIKQLLQMPSLIYRKGQQYKGKKNIKSDGYGSVVGRGHVSFLEGDEICLGSTYETDFIGEDVDKNYAEKDINSKIEPWFGSLEGIENKEFVSAVRVGQNGSYLPIAEQIDENTYIFTALGSRGLLYHAYYGKILSSNVRI
jgi:glycine/D-amino acid oxidase-like deaminating enzyme